MCITTIITFWVTVAMILMVLQPQGKTKFREPKHDIKMVCTSTILPFIHNCNFLQI